jgi:hypothetical protein
MRPEGPFTSPWTTGDWYLVSTLTGNDIVYSVVQNGSQPREGTLFPSYKNARMFLRENGFLPKERK